MRTAQPHTSPTEQELRDHFGDKLPADARLIRPDHTTIWALEDGTLLWDWRNGYVDLAPQVRTLIYLTGKRGDYGVAISSIITDAIEVDRAQYVNSIDLIRGLSEIIKTNNVIIFSTRYEQPMRSALIGLAKREQMIFACVEI